jgi:hypothetical protein
MLNNQMKKAFHDFFLTLFILTVIPELSGAMIGKSYLYIYKGKIFFVITNESKTSY